MIRPLLLVLAYLIGSAGPQSVAFSLPPDGGKLPVPDPAAIGDARKAIREAFKEDYARRQPGQVGSLARKLLAMAVQGKEQAARRYALFQEAAALAGRAGDARTAVKAIEDCAKVFQVDVCPEKAKTLGAVTPGAKDSSLAGALAEEWARLLEESLQAEMYEVAATAVSNARKHAGARNTSLVEQLREREKELEALRSELPRAQEARLALERNPEDSKAHLLVGRYLCYLKGDWNDGLPHLAKSLHVDVTQLAERDLDKPMATEEKVRVGDGWWDLAPGEQPLARKRLRDRAGHWYLLALPGLSGPTQETIETRLEEIGRLGPGGIPKGAFLIFTFEKGTVLEKGGRAFVKDLSGKANDGEARGAKPAKGKAGGALSFDGLRDSVDCGSVRALNSAKALTVCAWVFASSFQADAVDYIVSKDDWQGAPHGFVLRCGQGGVPMFTIGSSGWHTARGPPLTKEEWHHLAAVCNQETIKLYVDGKEAGSAPAGGPIQPSTLGLQIGGCAFDSKRRFCGLIDEVAIFERDLAEAEILILHERGRKGQKLR